MIYTQILVSKEAVFHWRVTVSYLQAVFHVAGCHDLSS